MPRKKQETTEELKENPNLEAEKQVESTTPTSEHVDEAEVIEEIAAEDAPPEEGAEVPSEPDAEAESGDFSESEDYFEDEDDPDEDGVDGPSLAARSLTWIAVFVAGAVFMLWAGPRVAPALPSGMSGLADWLTPGARRSEAQMSAFREEIEAKIAAIDTGADMTPVHAAIAEAEARLNATIGSLDVTDPEMAGRISQMESQITGLRGEIDAWNTRLQGAEIAGGQISEATATEISSYGTAIAGLRREIEQLAARQGELAARLDAVNAAADERVQAAEFERDQARTDALLHAIGVAMESGMPFEEELAALKEETGSVPEALSSSAREGVATLDVLRRSFGQHAHEAIRATMRENAGGGMFSQAGSFLRSQVATRSLEPIDGSSTDAVLSRAEDKIRRDDLSAALTELDSLSETASQAMSGWIAMAQSRQDALQAYRLIESRLAGGN